VGSDEVLTKGQADTVDDIAESRSRLDSLTSLRFIAALLVFASHVFIYVWYKGQDPQTDFATGLVMRLSLAGVEFFFLLSGFVLTWSARPTDTLRGFWRRRLVKIYPNHVVTWVIGLILLLWTGQQVSRLLGLSTLFLVDAWIPSEALENGVNPVSWSLGCEMFFYLCFPFLLRLIVRIRPSRLWWYAAGCVAVIAAIPFLGRALTPAEPKWAGLEVTFLQHWLAYTFPVTRIFEFILGIVLARIVITGGRYPGRFWYALVALPIGIACAMSMDYPYGTAVFLLIPLALAVLAGANADIGARNSFLRRPVWVWLGTVSFAFYMTHLLVIQYTYPYLDPTGSADTVLKVGYSVVYAVVSLIAAWLLYALVERPMMRRWASPRRKQTQTTGKEAM
jgi:peptidoglycan/LPS O-acetylase OafA/YrhL